MTIQPSTPGHRSDGSVPRSPVLFPASLHRADDAGQRIAVLANGALVHRTAGGERQLLDAGELTSATLADGGARIGRTQLPAGRGGWVVLQGRDRAVALSLPGCPRRARDPARDEIAIIALFFAVPLCVVSAASGGPFAAGIAAGAAALATGLLVHRLRRSW